MHQIIVSIDWLQYSCRLHGFTLEVPETFATVVKLPYNTRVFSIIEEIHHHGEVIAVIARAPFSKIIHPATCIVKFSNKLLYTCNMHDFVPHFFNVCGMSQRGLTRIDICGDFQSMNNYQNPEHLIKDFASFKLRKTSKSKFTLYGHHDQSNTFNAIKFGSPTSKISTYMYNKTLELAERQQKPYIVDMWCTHGFATDVDTWRLEFSIKGNSFDMICTETGEISNISQFNVLSTANHVRIFAAMLRSHFSFTREVHTSNMSRAKKLQFFDITEPSLMIRGTAKRENSTRATKILLNRLARLKETGETVLPEVMPAIDEVTQFVQYINLPNCQPSI